MKEITRIHIAKVAYDSETEAKKALESYIVSLRAYADDDELIEDIEIRITELLADRGVQKNGIITVDDITAIKEQLGKPSDFMSDGDLMVIDDEQIGAEPVRRYYRDTDSAVLGGVLGGAANYFGINPLWARLVATILLFASFGTATIVYVVLWLVVPPARTATQRLQMSGRPVTIQAIRELNEREGSRTDNGERSKLILRVVTVGLGVLSVLGAIAAAAVTFFSLILVVREGGVANVYQANAWTVTAFWIAVASGLLLAALFLIGAYASFMQRLTKRIIIAASVITIAGAGLFASAVGMVIFGDWNEGQRMERSIVQSTLALPGNFSQVESVAFVAPGVNVVYVVDDKPRMTVRSINAIEPDVRVDGTSARVSLTNATQEGFSRYVPVIVTIYGPALKSITVEEGDVDYEAVHQAILTAIVSNGASLVIDEGLVDSLTATVNEDGSLHGSDATIKNVTVDAKPGAVVELGAISTLALSTPDACPVDSEAEVTIWKLASDTVTINDTAQSAQSIVRNCMTVTFGSDDEARAY